MRLTVARWPSSRCHNGSAFTGGSVSRANAARSESGSTPRSRSSARTRRAKADRLKIRMMPAQVVAVATPRSANRRNNAGSMIESAIGWMIASTPASSIARASRASQACAYTRAFRWCAARTISVRTPGVSVGSCMAVSDHSEPSSCQIFRCLAPRLVSASTARRASLGDAGRWSAKKPCMNGSGKPPLKPPGATNMRGAALDGSADDGPRPRKESDGAITSAEVTPSASAWASLGRAVEWVCTSTRPGITHRPVASRTVACGGIGTLPSGPTVTIRSPRMTIVIRSRGEALMPSITVAERSTRMSCAPAVPAHNRRMATDDARRRIIGLLCSGERVKPSGSRLRCGRTADGRKEAEPLTKRAGGDATLRYMRAPGSFSAC